MQPQTHDQSRPGKQFPHARYSALLNTTVLRGTLITAARHYDPIEVLSLLPIGDDLAATITLLLTGLHHYRQFTIRDIPMPTDYAHHMDELGNLARDMKITRESAAGSIRWTRFIYSAFDMGIVDGDTCRQMLQQGTVLTAPAVLCDFLLHAFAPDPALPFSLEEAAIRRYGEDWRSVAFPLPFEQQQSAQLVRGIAAIETAWRSSATPEVNRGFLHFMLVELLEKLRQVHAGRMTELFPQGMDDSTSRLWRTLNLADFDQWKYFVYQMCTWRVLWEFEYERYIGKEN